MFQLDDNFLKDLGVVSLPDDQKEVLLQHIYEELEVRVGTQLAEGLSDEQMEEFDALLQRDEGKIRGWLSAHVPEYASQEDYQKFMHNAKQDVASPDIAVLSEYVATKWLDKNRPEYRTVVAAVLEELKKEIIANRDAILAT
jgi:hypothetical protein